MATARTGVGVVDLAGVDPTEHGDGHRREVAERGHRLAVGRVDVGEELVEGVRGGVHVGRHHHVGTTLPVGGHRCIPHRTCLLLGLPPVVLPAEPPEQTTADRGLRVGPRWR